MKLTSAWAPLKFGHRPTTAATVRAAELAIDRATFSSDVAHGFRSHNFSRTRSKFLYVAAIPFRVLQENFEALSREIVRAKGDCGAN